MTHIKRINEMKINKNFLEKVAGFYFKNYVEIVTKDKNLTNAQLGIYFNVSKYFDEQPFTRIDLKKLSEIGLVSDDNYAKGVYDFAKTLSKSKDLSCENIENAYNKGYVLHCKFENEDITYNVYVYPNEDGDGYFIAIDDIKKLDKFHLEQAGSYILDQITDSINKIIHPRHLI